MDETTRGRLHCKTNEADEKERRKKYVRLVPSVLLKLTFPLAGGICDSSDEAMVVSRAVDSLLKAATDIKDLACEG